MKDLVISTKYCKNGMCRKNQFMTAIAKNINKSLWLQVGLQCTEGIKLLISQVLTIGHIFLMGIRLTLHVSICSWSSFILIN